MNKRLYLVTNNKGCVKVTRCVVITSKKEGSDRWGTYLQDHRDIEYPGAVNWFWSNPRIEGKVAVRLEMYYE